MQELRQKQETGVQQAATTRASDVGAQEGFQGGLQRLVAFRGAQLVVGGPC